MAGAVGYSPRFLDRRSDRNGGAVLKKKAVFFDVDGTLFDMKYGIPESAKDAIRKLRKNGHYAFICTGRTGACLFDEELFAIGFDGMISACGAYVRYGDEVLLDYKMPVGKLKRTLDIMNRYRMIPVLEGEEYLYYDRQKLVVEKKDPYMTYMERVNSEHLSPLPDQIEDMHVKKYCVSLDDIELAQEGLRLLAEEDTIMHLSPIVKEVVPSQFSKATGMELICRRIGIEMKDTFAFGDSANDIVMLRAAGCGIAMGNACREAKETADYVTAALLDDGIYKGLAHFGLI